MTAPRQIVPGTMYMVTRRCAQRQLLLRPSETINQIFTYCLAFAAAKTGVLVHAYLVLSNHYHLILKDVEGRLPEFTAELNRLVGKCVNTHLGRSESLWSSDHYSAVKLEDEDALWEKLLYVLTNAIAAGLVPRTSVQNSDRACDSNRDFRDLRDEGAYRGYGTELSKCLKLRGPSRRRENSEPMS